MKMLLVEDNEIFAKSIEVLLKAKAPFSVDFEHVTTLSGAIQRLQNQLNNVDVILLDLSLPDSSGIETLMELQKNSTGVPIVVLTGSDSDIGLEAVKRGAQDYLLKGAIDASQLIRAVQYAVERAAFLTEREDFIATLTHDLKNPLLGCDRLLEVLDGGQVSWEAAKKDDLIQHIRTSNRAVISMIDTLLDVYKHEKTLAELALEHTNLVQLASSCIAEWAPIARLRGVELVKQIEDDDVHIMIDAGCIRRVFQNLIDNAIKYSTVGSVVTVRVFEDERHAYVEITNEGQLLSHNDLNNLFNRFWRGPNRKNSVGMGLGLYLCRQMVELHRGKIGCTQSDDGKSTVFSFQLPKTIRAAC
jgi:signal transduction histidine kinase